MIGRKAEAVLNRAVRYAVEQEHEYFTLEHVMWSLLAENDISELIRACGGNPRELKQALETYMQAEVPKAQGRPDSQAKSAKMESGEEGDESSDSPADHPVATVGIQRLVQRALFHVQSAGKDEIQPTDLLVAFFQAKESFSLHLLAKQGIERLDVLNFLSHGLRKDGATGEAGDFAGSFSDEVRNQMREGESREARDNGAAAGGEVKVDPLKAFTLNLNERARMGKIDPLIGREAELERMIQTLCRRRKNNPLLVGEAGVGKTALAEGLALRIVNEEVPDLLHNAVIYALDLGSLIAGTKFRGDFEQRLKRVLSALQKKKEQGLLPILLIDEIHTIVGAGAVSGGALDAANLLKPALAQGELRCIGSTTYPEYRNVFEKDHALARRFQKIDIAEPGVEDAVQILTGLKPRFEEHHGVRYTPEAIRAAVELSVKHLSERYLPDKAIDVVDEAGARARILRSRAQSAAEEQPARTQEIKKEKAEAVSETGAHAEAAAQGSHDSQDLTTITAELIEEMIAQIARIPARTVSVSQKDRLRNLERDLRLSVYGQDAAVDALVTAIRLARSGLRSGDRPVGSFLFCGPTGVGKTELSKQLAHCLGVPFLRFDMSEYSEKHTVSRLIGAPPGYVGFDQAGLLTDSILKNPHSVVLLDEIEKAHPEIWNILLQVMDHGTLTDNNGRKADFRNAVIIMTSNVGSRDMERRPLGMGDVSMFGNAGAQKALEQTFSPEFRNRLDAIVFFNSLTPAVVAQVVGKVLVELEAQLLSKGVEAEFTAEAREWLARKGYDRQMGARPLGRLLQDQIKKPLAEEILFGRLENGGEVKVGLDATRDELTFDIRARAPDPRKERVAETVPH